MSTSDIIGISQTIVFVATAFILWWQLQSLKKSIRGEIYAELNAQVSRINEFWIEHPSLASLWGNVKYVVSEGTEEEIRTGWMIIIMMDFYQHLFYQHLEGNLSKELWKGWKRHIGNVFKKSSAVQEQWQKTKDVYHVDFVKWIDKVIYNNHS